MPLAIIGNNEVYWGIPIQGPNPITDSFFKAFLVAADHQIQ
jgi:hypothetical protein